MPNTTKHVLCNDKSSKRILNRLYVNGPRFHLGREMPIVYIGGEMVKARLLHSTKTNWVGWVPAHEISIRR